MSILKAQLQQTLIPINQALTAAINELPSSCQSVARYVTDAGGKRMRPFLTVIFAHLFGFKDASVFRLAISMELLHAATLLHDDVLDNAQARRGKQAAHLTFGASKAILAGDAMLALANSIVASFDKPSLCACFSLATMNTAAGEILEIDSLGKPELDFSAYVTIAAGKTGNLLAQSCALGAIMAGAEACAINYASNYGENLGIAFQIIDDCLDFSSQEITGKPVGGDLREKKLTPPIQLFRQSLDEAERLAFDNFFTSENMDEFSYKKYVSAISAFAPNARKLAGNFLDKALEILLLLPQNEENVILREIVEKAASREK